MEQERLIIIGILAGIYIVIMPIVLALIPFLHKKLVIQKKMNKMAANERARYKPNLLGPIWRERLSYTMKDKRDFSLGSGKKKKDGEPSSSKIQNRQMLLIIWGIGLITVLIGAFLMNWYVLAAGYIIFFFAAGFGITASKDMIEARKRIMTRLFEIANSKLGIGHEYAENPGAVIKVLEWNDPLKPAKIEFTVPTTFNAEQGEEGFLRQFNQVFGQETTWVPFDDKETGKPGWNYEEGIATFYAVPPLPTMAPWAEHYITHEAVAWSYFPIALGVENGIALPHPETGEVENVLGFDFSGEQPGLAKKHGIKVGGEITTSPMCVTGDTLVLTKRGTLSIKEISELNEPIEVKSMNGKFELVWNKMFGTKITRINAPIVELVFEDGSKVRCTPDHEWMLSYGTYVEAKDLLNLYVKGYDQPDLKVVEVNDAGFADVYDGEVKNTHNFVVITNDDRKGIISSNCFVGGGTGGGKALAVDTTVKIWEESPTTDKKHM